MKKTNYQVLIGFHLGSVMFDHNDYLLFLRFSRFLLSGNVLGT